MKTICLTAGFSFAILALQAQHFSNPDLNSMIDAERAFILTAREEGTREAFLTFMSEEGVEFEQGPMPAKKMWEQRPEDNSLLAWEPDFSDISASGDFGYNTGPWEYWRNREDQAASGYGHFVTVWQKENGFWKAIVDIGIHHAEPAEGKFLSASAIPTAASETANASSDVQMIENEFLAKAASKGVSAYDEVLSEEARFYRSGERPYEGPGVIKKMLGKSHRPPSFHMMDGIMASSGDMGVVYGIAAIEAEHHAEKANYMRIWKKEKGDEWKIVVEVIAPW